MKLKRRHFILGGLLGLPGLVCADANWCEPKWLKIEHIRLSQSAPTHRFVHFTDLHHKGDRAFLQSVVETINSLKPDFVCFTGDLIEEARFLDETLEFLSQIKSPLYGCPGNHDYWSRADFTPIRRCFAATGGAWLYDEYATTPDGAICISGSLCLNWKNPHIVLPKPGVKNIALFHYPLWMENLAPHRFDVMLAGHSHGGQFRIPFWGAIMVPWGVGRYEKGMFQTPSGPMYVNPGIGYIAVNVRFNCRPEITLFEI